MRFNKSLPMSASTVYLKKESTNESIAFVVGIVKNLEPLKTYRNSQLEKLL